ncbi:MAG: SRPBCC domain-containing protein [Chloroflexota bacterium]|nr:SRPBCC domain-containing protein [Chloroflexota bacterium]
MSANQSEAEIARASDDGRIRIERTFAHPIERVWAALTERDRLAEWIGPGEIEPPRLLQFRFVDGVGDDNMVRFDLTERGDATHLVLTQSRVPSDRDLADNAAGWHMRIDMLGASLDHGMQEISWDKIGELTAHYADRVAMLSTATP